jgi:hypothetical protein
MTVGYLVLRERKYGIDVTSLGKDVAKNKSLLYFLKDIGVINLI